MSDSPHRPLPAGLRPETLAVRAALPPSQHGENSEGLFLTTAYIQPDAETSAQKFSNSEDFTYSRTSNPTVRSLEARLAALEGTEAAIATSTGMSAILLLAMGTLKAGDHVVCSRSVFGSTINLFAKEFGKSASRRALSRRPTWPSGRPLSARRRDCSSPRRRPTR